MAGTMELPWTTSREHVDGILQELDLSTEPAAEARRLATEYDGDFGATPKTVAAAAVYWASLIHNEKVTQRRIADAAGCGVQSIRRAYPEIVEREGYALPERESDDGQGPGPRRSITVSVPGRNVLGRWFTPTITVAAAVLAIISGIAIRPVVFEPATAEAFRQAAGRTLGPNGWLGVADLAPMVAVVVAVAIAISAWQSARRAH